MKRHLNKLVIEDLNFTLSISMCLPLLLLAVLSGCQERSSLRKNKDFETEILNKKDSEEVSCHTNIPTRYASATSVQTVPKNNAMSKEGMVRIPAGTFLMGADDKQADADEYPKHEVVVDAVLWMNMK